PTLDSLELDGLDVSAEDLQAALAVDDAEWKAELPLIEEWFATIGDKLPEVLREELDHLRSRLG
ncbi:MAG: phosphoenolpyruvate carboxykinase domain-containing protein, partial [Mycobacteriaceae bacterium]